VITFLVVLLVTYIVIIDINSNIHSCSLFVLLLLLHYFQPTLNALMAAGHEAWTETRSYLQKLLNTDSLTSVKGYVMLIETCRNL